MSSKNNALVIPADAEMHHGLEQMEDGRMAKIRSLFHDLQNNLQVMSFELELIGTEPLDSSLAQKLTTIIDKMKDNW